MEVQEVNLEATNMNDMLNVERFSEGHEPSDIQIEESREDNDKGGKNTPPASETQSSGDVYPSLKALSTFLNEGIEGEDGHILFDETAFTGKKEDGTDFTLEEKKGAIISAILDKTMLGANQDTDKFIRDLIYASYEDGFDINSYMNKGGDSNDMTADEMLQAIYTKKYGTGTEANLTDEEVEEKLQSLSSADKKLLLAEFKQQQRQVETEEQKKAAAAQEKAFLDKAEKYNSDTETALQLFVEQSKGKDIFGGFKFGQADKEEYLKEVSDFMKRKVISLENGDKRAISPAETVLQDMLVDPKSILELIPFLWMKSKGKLDGYSTMLTEQVKWDMLDRLDENARGESYSPGKEGLDMDDMLITPILGR